MPKNKHQRQTANQTGFNDAEEVVNLQSTIEFLSEQIESLKLELSYKDTEIKLLEDNLSYTDEQLESLNEENHYLAVENQQLRLSLGKVKELAQEFLLDEQDKQLIKETFMALVSEVIDTGAEPWKLENKQNELFPPQDTPIWSILQKNFSVNFNKFQTHYNEFGSRFLCFQAQMMRLKNKLDLCEKPEVDNSKDLNEPSGEFQRNSPL